MRAMPEATAGSNTRDRDERAEKREPADGDVRVAHVPAVEIEIGEQEHQQRGREDRFAARRARCARRPADMSNTLPQNPKSMPI